MFQQDDGDDDIDESRVDLASEWIWGRRGCGGGGGDGTVHTPRG